MVAYLTTAINQTIISTMANDTSSSDKSHEEHSDLITVARAMAILDETPEATSQTTIALADSLNRILAEDIVCDRDFPAIDKSQMDGFAVHCADVLRVPVELPVVGEILAGASMPPLLQAGQTMAIMTGAPLPMGADGIIPVEETVRLGNQVRFNRIPKIGRYIAIRGSDMTANQIVLRKQTVIGPAQIAVLASIGKTQLTVFNKTRVGILATGNEIISVDQSPNETQTRNCNSPMIQALCQRYNCQAIDLGIVVDDPIAIRIAMMSALEQCQVLFVTGGMSMGTADYVPQIIRELGFETRISKLRIKPGKPFVFAVKESLLPDETKYIIGLPGNPVSGFVCTLRLASRLLNRLSGGTIIEKWLVGKLEAGLSANGPREFYQPVQWKPASSLGGSARNEFASVTPLEWKGSADIFTLASANALLVRGENEPPMPRGTLVRVLEM